MGPLVPGGGVVSKVKRYLEERTDAVLDSVRLTGSAVLVARTESDRYGWDPYALLERTLSVCAEQWLCAPSREERDRIAQTRAALQEWVGPAPTDVHWNYREALEDAADGCLESLAEWLGPYGLVVEWETVGLCVRRGEEQ